jgi:hypothetical protein
MKTQFKTIIKTVIFTLITFTFFGASAQSYYTPGQNYSFRNKIDATHTLKVNVVYDASGNATVTKSMVSPISTDIYNSFIFCDDSRVSYSSESNCASFTEELTDFWVIELETVNEDASPVGGGVCFSCPCAKKLKDAVGVAECQVKYIKENSTFNINCEVTATCEECGKLTISSGSGTQSTNQILIIQANSVQF